MYRVFLVLFSTIFLSATALDNPHQVYVSCANSEECTVKFTLDDGIPHSVTLIKEQYSVFAQDAIVGFFRGGETKISNLTRQGDHFHTRKGEHSTLWATAVISKDRRELLAGTFSTEQGIMEFGRDATESTLQRRRSLATINDIVLANPLGTPWKDGAFPLVSITAADDTLPTPRGQITPFFPNCYQGDTVTHVFKMSLIYDNGLYSELAAKVDGDENTKMNKILADLETLFAFGKLIYLVQLNVRLEIQHVIFGKPSDPIPLSRGGRTCTTATAAIEELRRWLPVGNANYPTGYWLLVSNCFSGVNGVSGNGVICGSLNAGVAAFEWPVMFHELGHGFGADHSFQNGVANTGGLMDYGDPHYNGVIQFHPVNRNEICPFLDYIQRGGKCPFFYRANPDASCGDGILDKSEQCECMTPGTRSCGKCIKCRLTDSSVQCSSSLFLVRQLSTPDTVVVEPSALSAPECCVNYRIAPPKTLCGQGKLDVCGAAAKCEQVCTKFLYPDNANCGFDDSGCKLGCVWSNKCQFDMAYHKPDGALGFMSAVPDGTSCKLTNGKIGLCKDAVCVNSSGVRDTSAPTTRQSQPTNRPTPSTPTQQQTPFPTKKPVQAPTNKPTKKAPTKKPTVPPTAPKDLEEELSRCSPIKKAKGCRKKNCAWCAPIRKCQPKGYCGKAKAQARANKKNG